MVIRGVNKQITTVPLTAQSVQAEIIESEGATRFVTLDGLVLQRASPLLPPRAPSTM